MTKEEAIAILDGFIHNPLFNEQHFEALDMAISALSNKGDSISRQAVLNTLDFADKALDEDRTVEKYKELLTECIKVLTSANVIPLSVLQEIKGKIEDCSFDYYFEYGEYIGKNPIQHRICMTDKVLEILSEYLKGGEE